MKRLWVFAGVVLLALILVLSFASSIVAQDHGPKGLTAGFSIDQGDHKVPRGSAIHHLGNGNTEVYAPDNSLVMRVKDSESSLVPTPSGPVSFTHVFNVPSGAEIARKGNETDVYENGAAILKVIDAKTTVPQFTGWVEQANNWSGTNLDYFSANWLVPSRPPNLGTSAIDFLFNAIEPNNGSEIIQPVLEWNQVGSSQKWTLASWYGPVNGNYYRSNPVTGVKSGDSLSGVLSHSWSGWSIVTRDINIKTTTPPGSTSISTRSMGTTRLAVFCALEGYYIEGNSDVPGTTTFNSMSFKYSGRNVNMTWQKYISSGTGLTGLNVETISSSKVILDTANP